MSIQRRTALARSKVPLRQNQPLTRKTPLPARTKPLKRTELRRATKPLSRSPLSRGSTALTRTPFLLPVSLQHNMSTPRPLAPILPIDMSHVLVERLDTNRSHELILKPLKKTKTKKSQEITDPRSPDLKRVLLEGKDWTNERKRTAAASGYTCEGCETPHYLEFGSFGHAHHRFGRGGGRRDDRLWRPMNADAANLLERWWVRNLAWACDRGHNRLHQIGLLKFRPSQMHWCPIHGRVVYETCNSVPPALLASVDSREVTNEEVF